MILEELARKKNLELAWRRITTGGNQQYKRLYRDLDLAYEIALNANLKGLRERILGGSFTPQRPERLYLPKPSGLHRPVTLLTLEDQIVLQAFANLAAKRMQPRRRASSFGRSSATSSRSKTAFTSLGVGRIPIGLFNDVSSGTMRADVAGSAISILRRFTTRSLTSSCYVRSSQDPLRMTWRG